MAVQATHSSTAIHDPAPPFKWQNTCKDILYSYSEGGSDECLKQCKKVFKSSVNDLDWRRITYLKNTIDCYKGQLNAILVEVSFLPKELKADLQRSLIKAFEKKWALDIAVAFYPIPKMSDVNAKALSADQWTIRYFQEASAFCDISSFQQVCTLLTRVESAFISYSHNMIQQKLDLTRFGSLEGLKQKVEAIGGKMAKEAQVGLTDEEKDLLSVAELAAEVFLSGGMSVEKDKAILSKCIWDGYRFTQSNASEDVRLQRFAEL